MEIEPMKTLDNFQALLFGIIQESNMMRRPKLSFQRLHFAKSQHFQAFPWVRRQLSVSGTARHTNKTESQDYTDKGWTSLLYR